MLVIWRLHDGKPGHDRQSQGLLKALAAITPVESFTFNVRDQRASIRQFLTRQLDFAEGAPAPDLIIGAGRRCQWPMLNVKRARGGNTIYLMKPQLPTRCFDLCLIPRHDQARTTPRALVTDGVLNDIEPSRAHGDEGLVLIGGPSEHYAWDQDRLMQQIRAVLGAEVTKKWVIADSRRTPPATSAALQTLAGDSIVVIGHHESTPNMVAEQLARTDVVWVSSDSVSMNFEAITSGAAVGVIDVPAKRTDRITTIVADLSARKLITTYTDWSRGRKLQAAAPLAEAARCAEIILARWDPSTRRLRAVAVP